MKAFGEETEVETPPEMIQSRDFRVIQLPPYLDSPKYSTIYTEIQAFWD